MKRFFALALLLFAPAFALAQDPLSGSGWRGYWQSESSRHSGPMRATIQPTATGYSVLFAGRFAKVIPFAYRTDLQVTGTSGDTTFLAVAKRLPLVGTFKTEAVATPTSFDATFESKKDRGRFVLTR